eukprot:scaffold513_cov22-Tisochrysis_lutea.AAC.3
MRKRPPFRRWDIRLHDNNLVLCHRQLAGVRRGEFCKSARLIFPLRHQVASGRGLRPLRLLHLCGENRVNLAPRAACNGRRGRECSPNYPQEITVLRQIDGQVEGNSPFCQRGRSCAVDMLRSTRRRRDQRLRAATVSTVLCKNEGNGKLSRSPPRLV